MDPVVWHFKSSRRDKRHKSLECMAKIDRNSYNSLDLHSAPGIFHLAFVPEIKLPASYGEHFSFSFLYSYHGQKEKNLPCPLNILSSTEEDTEVSKRILKSWRVCWSTRKSQNIGEDVEVLGRMLNYWGRCSHFVSFLPTSLQDRKCLIHWTKLSLLASENRTKSTMQVFFALWVCKKEDLFSYLPYILSWPRAEGLPLTCLLCLSGVLLLSEMFVPASKTKRMILWFCNVCCVFSDAIATWKATLGTAEWASGCQHFRFFECLLSTRNWAKYFYAGCSQQPCELTNKNSHCPVHFSAFTGSMCRVERYTCND